MVVIHKDYLPEQLSFKGLFKDYIEEGNARANLWARTTLGEDGYQTITTKLGREPDMDELIRFADEFAAEDIYFDTKRFSQWLEDELESTTFYPLSKKVAKKHGYTGKDGVVALVPLFWQVIVGPGEENSGAVYIGDDPFEGINSRLDFLEHPRIKRSDIPLQLTLFNLSLDY